jgi:hypothetical protein
MSLQYHVYANDGQGSPVDYSHPIATVTVNTFTTPTLASPSDNTFAVRVFDTVSGLEESNTDARVRIVIDTQGRDITTRPDPVHALSVRPLMGAGCRVSWAYIALPTSNVPQFFLVSIDASGSTNPIQSQVGFIPGIIGYSTAISGLTDGVQYTVTVQSVGNQGYLISDPVSIGFTADGTAPVGVDDLVVG